MTACRSCGAARPGSDFACLACGASAEPLPRSRVQIELAPSESDDILSTTSVLERLVSEDPVLVRKVCEQAQVSLVAELSAPERERLFSLLARLGVRFREGKALISPETESLRFVPGRELVLRGAIVLGLAVATFAFGLNWLSYLAAPVAAVIVFGHLERVPHALQIPARAVDEHLGAADHGAWREAAILRGSIRGDVAARALGGLVAALSEVIGQIRSGGLPLMREDFSDLDRDAHALLRRALRLAAAADRIELACQQELPPARKARLTVASREIFAALAELERKIRGLHASLVQLSGLDASNEELVAVTSRVAELQIAVETALELSAVTRVELES